MALGLMPFDRAQRDAAIARGANAGVSVLFRVWSDRRLFFFALVALELFFVRRTFQAGIWADNDSVSHYAYLRYLVEEFYPATHSFFGWCPKYNVGLPYLLFNTPPGLYVTAAVTSLATGLSPLMALKFWMTAAYLAVPILGYFIARTFSDPTQPEPTGPRADDLPKFTALTLGLFSSELFGLEFFFKNGMLNAAFAVPMAMAAVLAFRHAQRRPLPRSLLASALGAVAFACTLQTHITTAYMGGIMMAMFGLVDCPKRIGKNLVSLGALVGIGILLAGHWLVPSLPLANKHEAAYTWIRNPSFLFEMATDGSLFSTYPVGFFPHFMTHSYVGFVSVIAAAFGLVTAIRRWSYPVLACAATALVAFWISVGPDYSFGISILPVYEKLLWYRFVTLAILAWFFVAAYGAWAFADMRGKFYPLNLWLVGGAAFWAFLVMTQRAVKIETAKNYPRFVESVDQVADWLKTKGDRRGRVYGEFLGHNVVEAVSVNYVRHMVPILSGFDELAGWIYENNPAGELIQRKGMLWYDPIPIVEEAPAYNVKYVVAGSPNLIYALKNDPRWKTALETAHLVLFESAATPAFAEADGYKVEQTSAHYLEGGGYAYAFALAPSGAGANAAAAAGARQLVVKTNFSPPWRATVDGAPAETKMTDRGLLSVVLPGPVPGVAAPVPGAHKVELTWEIDELRSKGRKVSFVGLAIVGALAFAGASRRKFPELDEKKRKALNAVAVGGLVVVLAALALHRRKIDLTPIGFGIADGMIPSFDSSVVRVGSFDDKVETRLNRVLPDAWGASELVNATHGRALKVPGKSAFRITLSPNGPNRLTLLGVGDVAASVAAEVRDEKGQATCKIALPLGTAIELPRECMQGARFDAPGVVRDVALSAEGGLRVTDLKVDAGLVILEAESFRNTIRDGGFEAFYTMGVVEYSPQNGVLMTAIPAIGRPIVLEKDLALPAKRYEAWALLRTVLPRFLGTRARIKVTYGDAAIADLLPQTRKAVDFWNNDVTFEWVPVGAVQGSGEPKRFALEVYKAPDTLAALSDIDALVLVP